MPHISELADNEEEPHAVLEAHHERVGYEAHDGPETKEAEDDLKDAREEHNPKDVGDAVLLHNLKEGQAYIAGGTGYHAGTPAYEGYKDVRHPC